MIQNLIKKIRALVHDDLKNDEDYFTYNGQDSVFNLSEASIDPNSVKVFLNGTLLNSSDYIFDSEICKISISKEMKEGDIINVRYQCYKNYTDEEIKQYIQSAIVRLSAEKYTTFIFKDDEIYPTPVESDENLIALIASILMEGNLSSYKTSELSLIFAKDEDNEARIKRAIRQFKKTYGVIDYINLRRS